MTSENDSIIRKVSVFIPIYIGDMLKDTQHLNAADFGSYHHLIYAYWTRGRPLPDDDDALRQIARRSAREWRKVRPRLAEFFQVGDGVWRHKRIEKELAEALRRVRRKSELGKLGNHVRWTRERAKMAGKSAVSSPVAIPDSMRG